MHSDMRIRTTEPRDVETIAELNMAMAWETEHMQLCQATLIRGMHARPLVSDIRADAAAMNRARFTQPPGPASRVQPGISGGHLPSARPVR